MTTYLIYKGYNEWQEVAPDPAEIEEIDYFGNKELRYRGSLLHKVDPAKEQFFYLKFPDEVHWMSKESFRRAFDMVDDSDMADAE